MKKLTKKDIIDFMDSLSTKYSKNDVKDLLISCYLRIQREEKLSHLLDEKESKS